MYRHFIKRFLDFLLAVATLPLFLLAFLIFGPIIYLQDKGSVFYNAERLGKDGKVFKMYKFRSMKMNAPDIRNIDGSTFNSENDFRLTPVGSFIRKTSIDELPQILNVIKGDMSFIGPRPDLPEAIDIYTVTEKRKLEVRPGISGYSQANFRNSISATDKFKNDVFYVDNVSIGLDIRIFFKTFLSIFERKNIFIKNADTFNEFSNKQMGG